MAIPVKVFEEVGEYIGNVLAFPLYAPICSLDASYVISLAIAPDGRYLLDVLVLV